MRLYMCNDENSAKHMVSTLSKLDIVVLKTRNLPIFQCFHYFSQFLKVFQEHLQRPISFFLSFYLLKEMEKPKVLKKQMLPLVLKE